MSSGRCLTNRDARKSLRAPYTTRDLGTILTPIRAKRILATNAALLAMSDLQHGTPLRAVTGSLSQLLKQK